MYRTVYAFLGSFTLFSIHAIFLYGFRFDEHAPALNYLWNLLLYGVFIIPHLIMTRSWFKQRFWGEPAGHPRERRFYIFVTMVTWFAVIIFHRPVPGVALDLPGWAAFAGLVFFLMNVRRFFEGVTVDAIFGLLGVPGAPGAYSHGPETPLFTDGPYAQVRHPMYQAFMLAVLSSLLVHPHTSQLFWGIMLGGTFVAFIPVEEAQMIAARGEDYRAYMQKTPYRIIPGLW